jgi:TrmH family RNA methyltransferase
VKLLTLARHLRQRKARERSQQFVAEGVRALEVLLKSTISVTGILAAPSLALQIRGQAILARAAELDIEVLGVSEAEFASAANTDTPQGVLAIADIPRHLLKEPVGGERYLILDALQDPGNAGTIIRTAAAFGVSAIIALPGTVDLWNAKVVRSAMGSHFTHQVLALSVAETAQFLGAHKVTCWAADTQGTPVHELRGSHLDRFALLVSNEGGGLTPEAAALASERVCIPMSPGVESLNVAVATGILLFALGARQSGATLTSAGVQ